MRQGRAIIGAIAFLFVAPGIVAGVIPLLISHGRFSPAFFGIEALGWVGVAVILIGLAPLLDSFARFAVNGGTPAPIAPPDRLVVSGFYRFVRNPMYLGVVAIIAGQGLLFANAWLFVYAAVVWLIFHLNVMVVEEGRLMHSFRWDYHDYCQAVPRWVPRLTPWTAGPPRVRPFLGCVSRICQERA